MKHEELNHFVGATNELHLPKILKMNWKLHRKMIQKENIAGVYVIPSYESSFGKWRISSYSINTNIWHSFSTNWFLFIVWFGVIFVRSGYYRDGIFRFNISLPKDFPNTTDVPVS